ncbi:MULTISPECIES: hotdog domain-containing protein [unclassified Bacillus (in: firmicutes)]|uniref:hotdog domain-containing protein n=1 Tax=unclassified Bacillus (in: firmicutes) TaxID=185979 RepID=UPI000BF050F7|nr:MULTISPECIES: hotdog domain-containing protein [unclassified Bacillus (in: firmicutes)]PEJ60108.1 enoyl-CoA hydratase [Bacillus sp. AFS002410]PEL07632.1 enoyl-CoA hydratase [Bacillus sp. AFS017336]
MALKVGDIISFERTFTVEDVELFTKVSGDAGAHHVTPDEQGRLVVQGLLTATLPTKIGGDHNVLARSVNFDFLRPVFTGDTIICEVTIEKYEKQENRLSILASFLCTNQNEKKVLSGSFSGVIL